MSSILRVIVKKDSLDNLLKGRSIEIDSIWNEGDLKFKTKPDKGTLDTTGFTVCLSDADFDEFDLQKREVTKFLKANLEELKCILLSSDVLKAKIDFGIYQRDVVVQSDYFDPDLIKLCASLSLGVELSQYPPCEED